MYLNGQDFLINHAGVELDFWTMGIKYTWDQSYKKLETIGVIIYKFYTENGDQFIVPWYFMLNYKKNQT